MCHWPNVAWVLVATHILTGQGVWWDREIAAVGTTFTREGGARLKKIVVELERDKLVLKQSLSHLEPRTETEQLRQTVIHTRQKPGTSDLPGDRHVLQFPTLPHCPERR